MNSPAILMHCDAPLSFVADHCRGRLCVMAAPWPRAETIMQSIEASVRAARWLLVLDQVGVSAICPLVQAVEMSNADREGCGPDLNNMQAWADRFAPIYAAAGVLIVPPLSGAAEDAGIAALARRFIGRNAPVFYLSEEAI